MRFGIISTAAIAREDVIPGIQKSDHEVLAIASRDGGRAEEVAATLDIPRSYGSYEALLADDDLDAVYNPLPNALHAPWTERAADAGLDVLCEKPLTADEPEAAELYEYCADRDVTLMEAFMYRFNPRTRRAVELVEERLENVHTVASTFTFGMPKGAADIRLDPDLAGGSVMDVGCYAINATRLFLGEPNRVYATTSDRRDSGVDTEMAGILEYDDGSIGRVSSGFDTPETQYYRVEADNGWVETDPAFDVGPDVTTTLEYDIDGEHGTETFDPVDQYRLEVDAFADAAQRGATPPIDPADTRGNMAVIDAIYESSERGQPVTLS